MAEQSDPVGDRGTFYGLPLHEAVGLAIDAYMHERSEYQKARRAEIGVDGEALLKDVDQTAQALIKGVGDLASLKSVPLARRLLQQQFRAASDRSSSTLSNVFALICEECNISIGWEAQTMIRIACERLWPLLVLSEPFNPTDRTASFLRRVSRCFLFGFDVECAVMCRAALDTAFDGEISTDDCIHMLGQRRSLRFTFADKIAVAKRIGRISEDTADDASEVKDAGDKAVHWIAMEHVDACQLIRKTLIVLGELYRESRRGE